MSCGRILNDDQLNATTGKALDAVGEPLGVYRYVGVLDVESDDDYRENIRKALDEARVKACRETCAKDTCTCGEGSCHAKLTSDDPNDSPLCIPGMTCRIGTAVVSKPIIDDDWSFEVRHFWPTSLLKPTPAIAEVKDPDVSKAYKLPTIEDKTFRNYMAERQARIERLFGTMDHQKQPISRLATSLIRCHDE